MSGSCPGLDELSWVAVSHRTSPRTWSVPHDFKSDVVNDIAHRPWPMPSGPWLGTQTWTELLFAHWRVDPNQLRPRIPPPFELDLSDNTAWIGVVPFQMSNVSLRGVPSIPWVSAFPEANVRTYVRVGDKPGVFFFSLDAASALAVRTARLLLNLPYYWATMAIDSADGIVSYRSERTDGDAIFAATYGPIGKPFHASRGSLEYFLTERYCLYHVSRRGAPYRLDIHHPPWALQEAAARLDTNTLIRAAGLSVEDDEPLVHFAKRQDTLAWAPSSALEA